MIYVLHFTLQTRGTVRMVDRRLTSEESKLAGFGGRRGGSLGQSPIGKATGIEDTHVKWIDIS